MQLDSREHGDPLVSLLTRDQSVTWFFKTREGALGVLQLVSFSDDPPSAKIRYKLVQQTNGEDGVSVAATDASPATLAGRLEAASLMTDMTSRNKAIAAIATDAARMGAAQVAKDSLNQINDFTTRNQTAHEAVRLLAKRGLKKQALEIAKDINDMRTRNEALSELAK